MQNYYAGKIKVVGLDMMCFPVNAKTLQPLSCGCYDPYAFTDPDRFAIETISINEWEKRRGLNNTYKDSYVRYSCSKTSNPITR